MTWTDPIVDEVRRVRDAYAAQFNYDLQAIFRDLKEQEKRSGRTIVAPPRTEPIKALPATSTSEMALSKEPA